MSIDSVEDGDANIPPLADGMADASSAMEAAMSQ